MILILEDSKKRIDIFNRIFKGCTIYDDAYQARMFMRRKLYIEELFLDYNLGNPIKHGNGMDLVTWLANPMNTNYIPKIDRIWIHSEDDAAPKEMHDNLIDAGYKVTTCPFKYLNKTHPKFTGV